MIEPPKAKEPIEFTISREGAQLVIRGNQIIRCWGDSKALMAMLVCWKSPKRSAVPQKLIDEIGEADAEITAVRNVPSTYRFKNNTDRVKIAQDTGS